VKRERESAIGQAKAELAKRRTRSRLPSHCLQKKLERTEQMLKVSEEVVALRSESNRVRSKKLLQGHAEIASCNATVRNTTPRYFSSSHSGYPRRTTSSSRDGLNPNDTLTLAASKPLSRGRGNSPSECRAVTAPFILQSDCASPLEDARRVETEVHSDFPSVRRTTGDDSATGPPVAKKVMRLVDALASCEVLLNSLVCLCSCRSLNTIKGMARLTMA